VEDAGVFLRLLARVRKDLLSPSIRLISPTEKGGELHMRAGLTTDAAAALACPTSGIP